MTRDRTKQAAAVLLGLLLVTGCTAKSATPPSSGETDNAPSAAVSQTEGAASPSTDTQTTAADQTAASATAPKVTYDADDTKTDWDAAKATVITLQQTNAAVQGAGAVFADNKVTIQAAGTYVLRGKLDDGQIVVDAADKGLVHLILDGVELHHSTSAPLYMKQAGKTVMTLAEGTTNRVSDGASYMYPDSTSDEPSAAVFSKNDLTINGTGALVIQANFNDGLTSKDVLRIMGGSMTVEAADDGIVGRDGVAVQSGTVAIRAKGDGIKATHDTDGEKGWIAVEGGSLQIEAGADGLQAVTWIQLLGSGLATARGREWRCRRIRFA